MKIKAVVDLGYGDSGKGNFVSYLCSISRKPYVIRFSGGHQAGHTVVYNGIRHVFSSFGSGTLQGILTYWSPNCTFSPVAFLDEYVELREKGIMPKICVDGACPVTTPYDVEYNQKMNEQNQHGSCGVGFGATLEREEKYYSLLVEDLQFPSIVKIKLEQIKKYYNSEMDEEIIKNFQLDCREALDKIRIFKEDFIVDVDTIIFEGSQGLLLDKDIGFFPHVTRANVGSKAIEIDDMIVDEMYYITRAYQTRHGNGPMTNENIGHNIKVNPNETNVPNYQGLFRRTLLDLDLLEYAILKDNSHASQISLVITCLDHIENEYRFTHKGNVVYSFNENEFISKISNILGIKSIYISKSENVENIIKWHE